VVIDIVLGMEDHDAISAIAIGMRWEPFDVMIDLQTRLIVKKNSALSVYY
jgi:hypothetical protein